MILKINFKNWEKVWRYYPFTVVNKWRSYDAWSLKYKAWQTELFVILGHFCLSNPSPYLTTWNIKTSKTWKKRPGDIIILHMRTTQNKFFCHFELFFFLLTKLQKNPSHVCFKDLVLGYSFLKWNFFRRYFSKILLIDSKLPT